MLSKRYTVVVADRASGTVRTLTVALRPIVLGIAAVVTLPVLMGLGARWSAIDEIERLRQANQNLEVENTSYRSATAQLTSQITALQAAITDLSERSTLDPAVSRAITRLPALVKNRALGGGTGGPAPVDWFATALPGSPENVFGALRDLLGTLEGRLQFVRSGVERRAALANATPSIWPAEGWLSGTYGFRRDPITGRPDYHRALDISTDAGRPIYASADGTIKSAGYSGPYGNLVEVDHGFGLMTRYGHMSRFNVKAGASVRRGDVIGYVGSTGRATGAHLHYEVLVNGQPMNPLQLLLPRTR
jgi:murein DD-endopeptidase MepM/ murein hydrolase activator NlpD